MNREERRRRKPATLGIDAARKVVPMSRNSAYAAIKETGSLIPGVEVIHVGQQMRVVTVDLERVLGVDVSEYLDPEEPEPASV